ncbi:16S rRNA (cytidine(1402)-2'-O)-methyltransferase [Campylobacter hepaticus]|uniref:16S rRNA (cytidine(1402)-2'-O)-methyltransferase n=1 Tax=Campylobacter hepaticus TaxID=1813019 RepID=UPI0029B1A5CD|nr:16S rRNA (cytidine(1402)-2'-O)-methyltransferase [Campylobacter hepaticus]MDX2323467.1 16S rRNA (cytidine(1402)-2'-O)-methyltransferase [Campylobacter hepaticus]MDX2331322.1 16S rRNA (cytidine(1402)-2'-O)-methyltransferase [Campylobacter hepaticus]MDX2332665.1 16S rRNA (cytidine(1402)-2'-O)-methyltransferase [Campylobacter hepaticus]MDX2371937.1 16S rRNA (cytidine(1402)-2'-O)-methyltransferase [Campylobacter hepaticus]MDX2397327.1 16S rRNA (cytidine(1402)-2'-O)-methyltransferase [Campylobac
MLYFIPTPIGNLNDISFRALKLLKTCKIIFCEDTRVSKSLIKLLNTKFHTNINISQFIPLHSHNEKKVLDEIDLNIFKQNIAYLSDAGMPGISDPGRTLIEFAQKHQIAYEVLTGANAALVALVSSSFCQKEFIFMGFLAPKGKERQKDIKKVLHNPYVSIIYESPKRILSLIEQIALLDPQREIFAIKEISKKFENKFKANAQELLHILKTSNLNGEWVVVVKAKEENFSENLLCEEDILELDLPLKNKAKLLAKMNGKNPKELYQKLLLRQN